MLDVVGAMKVSGAVTLTALTAGRFVKTTTAGLLTISGSNEISLTSEVGGILPVGNGGTGANTLTDSAVLLGNGTAAVQGASPGTAGYVLTSNGAGVDPSFQAVSAAMVVGNAVTGGGASRILFQDISSNLATSVGLKYFSTSPEHLNLKDSYINIDNTLGTDTQGVVIALTGVGGTTHYGIYVTVGTGATNNYSLFLVDGDMRFGNSASKVGFYGTASVAKPTVTGSRGANAALASLLTALAGLGLLTDSSS